MSGHAIIAGSGDLPRLLAATGDHHIVRFDPEIPDWIVPDRLIRGDFGRLSEVIAALQAAGVTTLVFAGALVRPDLDAARADSASLELAAGMYGGDDATLRTAAAFLEALGFRIAGAEELAPGLVMAQGVLGRCRPSGQDRADITRALAIARALGAADAGQAAVVAGGICLGLESIQGTDALLDFVASTPARLRGRGGVLVKAAKPGQDLRFDRPVAGPETMRRAAAAGLAGVVLEAGLGLLLGRAETVAEADRLGLFLLGQGEG
jgi:hypothetical protein